ncbi:unnamed protein product [Merluccius merluccius]
MGLVRVLFSLLNNPRVIEKLSESRPIRRAAQVAAYALTKAQIAGRDASERLARPGPGPGGDRLWRLRDTFMRELKDGWRDASRKIKK